METRTMKEVEIILIEGDGPVFGIVDSSRWENAKWYQKLLGNIFYNYKKKFIDTTPLKAEYKGNATYEVEYPNYEGRAHLTTMRGEHYGELVVKKQKQ